MGEEQEKGYSSIIATRLRYIRDKRKITQKAIADQTGISRTSIGYYFNGDNIPDAINLAKIAKAMNVSADYLLGLTDNETSEQKEIETYADITTTLDQISFLTGWNIDARYIEDVDARMTFDLVIQMGNDSRLYDYYSEMNRIRKLIDALPPSPDKENLFHAYKEKALKDEKLNDGFLPF